MDWYNGEHLHCAVGYVTPNDRHAGKDVEILAQRCKVCEAAKRRHPERWTEGTRNWSRIEVVKLNPDAKTNHNDNDYDVAARSHTRPPHILTLIGDRDQIS